MRAAPQVLIALQNENNSINSSLRDLSNVYVTDINGSPAAYWKFTSSYALHMHRGEDHFVPDLKYVLGFGQASRTGVLLS